MSAESVMSPGLAALTRGPGLREEDGESGARAHAVRALGMSGKLRSGNDCVRCVHHARVIADVVRFASLTCLDCELEVTMLRSCPLEPAVFH